MLMLYMYIVGGNANHTSLVVMPLVRCLGYSCPYDRRGKATLPALMAWPLIGCSWCIPRGFTVSLTILYHERCTRGYPTSAVGTAVPWMPYKPHYHKRCVTECHYDWLNHMVLPCEGLAAHMAPMVSPVIRCPWSSRLYNVTWPAPHRGNCTISVHGPSSSPVCLRHRKGGNEVMVHYHGRAHHLAGNSNVAKMQQRGSLFCCLLRAPVCSRQSVGQRALEESADQHNLLYCDFLVGTNKDGWKRREVKCNELWHGTRPCAPTGECLPGARPARYFSINYPDFSPRFTLSWRSPPSRPCCTAHLPYKARCIIRQYL